MSPNYLLFVQALIKKDTNMLLKDVKFIFTSILSIIQLTLGLNGGVNIRGFGKFESQLISGKSRPVFIFEIIQ
jgi:nucleoid DNA-binding protein